MSAILWENDHFGGRNFDIPDLGPRVVQLGSIVLMLLFDATRFACNTMLALTALRTAAAGSFNSQTSTTEGMPL